MKYVEEKWRSFRVDDDGSMELMANFVATITHETRIVDGLTTRTMLTIEAEKPPENPEASDAEPIKLPPVEINADDFPSLNWVMPNWGVSAVIRPGSGIKDDLRTMIQLRSKPDIVTIYKQTGWQTVGNQQVYLHTGGGITKRGNDPSVKVRLPNELSRYDLSTKVDPADGVRSSLALLDLGRKDLTWPLLAGVLAPLYGQVDFAIHLTGRTGSFKSEVMSLYQSHFGPGMDARHLPGSWSSTPNALEALAFYAKNAVFVIDDFVPSGTSWQQRAYQQNADKIVRSQGNQAGRARLTDTSNLQQTMYPRGIIFSTGEDTPEGHSVRARMLILEVSAGEVTGASLTKAQAMRAQYSATVAWTCQVLAGSPQDLTARTEQLRTAYRDIGHSRTPGMLGRLVATCENWLQLVRQAGFIDERTRLRLTSEAKASIEAAGALQQGYLEDADPVDQFVAAIRQVVASGGGHFRTLNGGPPRMAAVLGWSEEKSSGELATFKSRGPCIGWVKTADDELYLDITAGFNIVKKAAGADLALSKQTLFKRMKDAGALVRTDEGRSRNTIRITAENHPRQVLCLALSKVLETQDVTGDNLIEDISEEEDHEAA